jgi:Cupin superfamily protein
MTKSGGNVYIEASRLASSMWRAPFQLRHGLAGHPLLTREAIVGLTAERPGWSVDFHRGNRPVVAGDTPAVVEGTAASVAADIENSGSWIVLSFVDHAPGYGDLLDETSVEFRSILGSRDGPARARTGTVFMSSPDGVTPAHFDRHHNILLQVEGVKELSVGEFDDDLARERELYRHLSGHDYMLALPQRFETFTLGPGDGVYIPPYAPHWIVCHHNVAIGLSCSVRTATSHRVELAHTFNTKLRRLGIHPRLPGARPRLDGAKAASVSTWRGMRHVLPGGSGPQ